MNYIGVDLGTSNVAITILRKPIETAFFEFPPDRDPVKIHWTIDDEISRLADMYDGDEFMCYVESVFKGPNQRTFQRMTRVAHSICIALDKYFGEVQYIEPSVWRKNLFGKGNKPKLECQEWAYNEYFLDINHYSKVRKSHVADSIMIALGGKIKHESL